MPILRPLSAAALLLSTAASPAIEIVLDFTLDEQNHNWFNPNNADGLARRQALESAAGFLSTIIRNDDWNALPSLNESITFSDIGEQFIKDLSGVSQEGTAEGDGLGYIHTISTTNRSSVGANQYIVYVGAFFFDANTSSHAIAGFDSNDRRNAAGFALTEFNTWGGRMWFDLGSSWYWGSNPGINPTNNFGTQDPNKMPATDISTDNWDWHISDQAWVGFQLSTIDPAASGKSDVYGVGLHELIHALGLGSTNMPIYVGVNGSNEATGANLVAEFGGPVPLSSSGGHFDFATQSEVWDSNGIISETTIDPNTTTGTRKYFTKLDAAGLRDLGYDVASSWSEVDPTYDLAITAAGSFPQLDWTASPSTENFVSWSTDLTSWTPISVGTANTWTDTTAFSGERYYKVTD